MQNLYIKWDERYNLGIPIIDEQHRAIVSTINTYHYFITDGNAEAALKPTFITLEQYTKTHFMTEEMLFDQTEYPETLRHKKLHEGLVKKMKDVAMEAAQEKDFDIVLPFLRKWWLDHIRIEDIKYAPYVKERLA
jgi:hemerythrin